jgi:two-component system chemotaxis response regulator CheY
VRYKELAKFRKPIRQRKRSSIDSRKSEGEASVERGKTDAVMILLVEDNQIVAGAVRETLELKEWKVETCTDGTAALERIAGDTHYDLLLLDYKLPDVDGLQLVKQARQLVHRSQTPIIMFSASPVEAAARDVGVDVFLRKPQDIGSLVETISRLLEEREQEH